jgi:four helix bundle protein
MDKWDGARDGNGTTKPKHYKELIVWQKAMTLAKTVYRLTEKFPGDERYGMTSQMRRAAVSIPSNIAEGQARRNTKEFLQFLFHARGSLAELETQMLLSADLGYARADDVRSVEDALTEIQKMLAGIQRKLSNAVASDNGSG